MDLTGNSGIYDLQSSRMSLFAGGQRGTIDHSRTIHTMKCVYCLQETPKDRITVDHVIARAWFPQSTPANTEKWKVPSCADCNNRFSKLENDIGLRIALCVDPNKPAAKGIWDKARRSIDPTKAHDERDRRMREKRLKQMLGDIAETDKIPETGVLPSFASNWEMGSRILVRLAADDLNALVTKWVRGIHYCEHDRFIASGDNIDILHLTEEVADDALREIRQFATVVKKGPGVEVLIIRAVESGEATAIFEFNIWGTFRVRAAVHEILA